MSEFTTHRSERVNKLKHLFTAILAGEQVKELYLHYTNIIGQCVPSDVVYLVDELVKDNIPMPELKTGINKLLNLLYKTLVSHPYYPPESDSYLGVLTENNRLMQEKLVALKPLIKAVNHDQDKDVHFNELTRLFSAHEAFTRYYLIKENVLFPVIERNIPEFRCLSVMWSFHDDIRRNLKKAIKLLGEKPFDLALFNRTTGDLFFNINAIRFREERILYPLVAEKIPEKELQALFPESLEIGFPFYQPDVLLSNSGPLTTNTEKLDLGTGMLSLEQIKLLFNHLPVDITFVDEHDRVQYFSTPPKRIFTRTKAIIGRDVHNCHPKESVHVVEKIVKAFREGKRNVASFWIRMKGEMFLIQYFAVRDNDGTYRGVVEVSQEIGHIRQLEGEQRLLDWEDKEIEGLRD
ncbi:MAG: DUF438 domain-containing protein [Draconibacterium sp.]